MKAVLQLIDWVGVACSRIAGWLFFAIGLMITYEVVGRYVFNAPTIWAEEMSRFFQVWAVYLGGNMGSDHGERLEIRGLCQK